MSFLRDLFGGQREMAAEDRTSALAFLVELNALRAIQDDEATRYNSALAKWGGAMIPGGEGLREVASAARKMADVNSDVVRRHAAISPIPDVAGPCFGAWWQSWQLLDQCRRGRQPVMRGCAREQHPARRGFNRYSPKRGRLARWRSRRRLSYYDGSASQPRRQGNSSRQASGPLVSRVRRWAEGKTAELRGPLSRVQQVPRRRVVGLYLLRRDNLPARAIANPP